MKAVELIPLPLHAATKRSFQEIQIIVFFFSPVHDLDNMLTCSWWWWGFLFVCFISKDTCLSETLPPKGRPVTFFEYLETLHLKGNLIKQMDYSLP